MMRINVSARQTRRCHIMSHWVLSLGTLVFLSQTDFIIGDISAFSAVGPVIERTDLEKGPAPDLEDESDGWEAEIQSDDGHEGHDHSSHEGHDHGDHEENGEHEEHEPGVVHLTEQSLENFGIKTVKIKEEDLTLTLDLYGWVRPRPQDVKIIRAPFPAIVAKVFAWPGQFVSENDLLVAFVIPEQLDWVETIFSSENELRRLDRLEGLLRNEGHAKAVELVGGLQVAAAEMKKLQAELDLLEQVGAGGVSKREVGVKKGGVEAARAEIVALRGIARTYGITPDRIKAYENGEEIGTEPNGAIPSEIRSKLDLIEFSQRKATISAQIAEAKLKILGTTGQQLEGLQKHTLDPLKNTFTARSAVPAVVTSVGVTPPTPVSTEVEIMRLVDYRKVYVEVEVPEVDVETISHRPADTIPIRVPSFPDRTLSGQVAYFDTEVRADERMAHLFIELENLEGMILRDGMAATVGIPVQTRRDTLAVPKQSVLTDGMEKVLFVKEGEDFRRVPVKTGVTTLDSIEIVEGLEPGQSVAVSGVLPLLLALQQQEGRSESGGHNHAH